MPTLEGLQLVSRGYGHSNESFAHTALGICDHRRQVLEAATAEVPLSTGIE